MDTIIDITYTMDTIDQCLLQAIFSNGAFEKIGELFK